MCVCVRAFFFAFKCVPKPRARRVRLRRAGEWSPRPAPPVRSCAVSFSQFFKYILSATNLRPLSLALTSLPLQVFPVARFEDFMVHHRTNNKNGKRGESTPAVSVSMLRLWAAQVVRDSEMLMEVGKPDPPPPPRPFRR